MVDALTRVAQQTTEVYDIGLVSVPSPLRGATEGSVRGEVRGGDSLVCDIAYDLVSTKVVSVVGY
jgi:hypothetical protein